MPVAIATVVLAFLANAMKGLVGSVLIALGLGVVTATGFHALFAAVLSVSSSMLGAPPLVVQVVNAVGLPWLFSTLLAAVTTRAGLRGLTSDGLAFWVLRRGIPAS